LTTRDQNPKTRRTILRAALAAAGGTIAAVTRGEAQTKIDQKIVQYQLTPKNNQKCSICVNFEAPKSCKIVSGVIEPEGWCIAFAPKST
jgi:hypothetical protein